MRKVVIYILNIMFVFLLVGCGKEVNQTEIEEPETTIESILQAEVEKAKYNDVEENSIDILQPPSKDYGEKLLEPENKYYNIAEYPHANNDETEYGNIKQEHKEFRDQNDNSFFYYDMECFYFNETYPAILNETLQAYYNAKKESYHHDSETYAGETYEGEAYSNIPPFDSLIFQCVTYAGDDYVSLLFNDVTYMGGAHPYSALDGITIDCGTGEIVTVNRFIDDTDEEIGEQIKTVLGIDVFDPKEWDYYITDSSVVFFYYDPRFWDSVATKRTDLGESKMEY